MVKKILVALGIAGALVFGVTACGGYDDSYDDDPAVEQGIYNGGY